MVCPTISGKIVELRAQVLMTLFSPRLFISSIFLRRLASIYGPFFNERDMPLLPFHLYLRPTPPDNQTVGGFLLSGPPSERRFPPRSNRCAADRRSSFTTAVRVINRVHRHTPHGRPPPQPADAPGLTDGDILMLHIAGLANGGHTIQVDKAHLAGGQADMGIVALFRHELRGRSGTAHQLPAAVLVQFNIMD